jgi:hypothetical protein
LKLWGLGYAGALESPQITHARPLWGWVQGTVGLGWSHLHAGGFLGKLALYPFWHAAFLRCGLGSLLTWHLFLQSIA